MSRGGERAGWLRRNGRALLAILVLLPATLGIMFANQWIRYVEDGPSRSVNVTAGETLEYGNARWRIEATDRVNADSAAGRERDLPAGTDLISVTVEVDPTSTGPDGVPDGCTARLEESGGGTVTRSWTNASQGAIDLGRGGPSLTSCSSDLSTRYSFVAEFVVPTEAGESSSLTVNITVAEFLPEYAKFALD